MNTQQHKDKAMESEKISKEVAEKLGLSVEELRQLVKDEENGRVH